MCEGVSVCKVDSAKQNASQIIDFVMQVPIPGMLCAMAACCWFHAWVLSVSQLIGEQLGELRRDFCNDFMSIFTSITEALKEGMDLEYDCLGNIASSHFDRVDDDLVTDRTICEAEHVALFPGQFLPDVLAERIAAAAKMFRSAQANPPV
eukprot:CAMPEP_0170605990 /NCGR_PEP_ID=MMETSP0224-20130122/20265_1 /TAXON_ID=285029 /ORGANISM="Togula jolla, Strain CCCM 725" /LENGTH=149 /DNA_ID=CAMNT_0010931025 /DNA_START=102 /DNA_END=550 /DNA_ORIENTATION=-